jgi:hypothetical protein
MFWWVAQHLLLLLPRLIPQTSLSRAAGAALQRFCLARTLRRRLLSGTLLPAVVVGVQALCACLVVGYAWAPQQQERAGVHLT